MKCTVGCTISTLIYSSEVSTYLPNYKSQKSIKIFKNQVLSVQPELGVRIDFQLCTLESAWSGSVSMSAGPGPLTVICVAQYTLHIVQIHYFYYDTIS